MVDAFFGGKRFQGGEGFSEVRQICGQHRF